MPAKGLRRPPSTADPAATHRVSLDEGFSLPAALRTVLPLWGFFTAFRWAVTVVAVHLLPPSSGAVVSSSPGILGLVDKWDAALFLRIAREGYGLESHPTDSAFFPGFPFAERLLAVPLSRIVEPLDAPLFSGFLLTTISSFVAALLIHRIAWGRFGQRTATWAVVLLMVWPSAAFLTVPYSEALYLVAAMGAWLLGTENRWGLAGTLCGVASFIRINGVFLCLALVVMYFTEVAKHRRPFRPFSFATILLGLGGTAAYFVFLYGQTGDVLAWSHAQNAGWSRETVTPWTSVSNSWNLMIDPGNGYDHKLQIAADMVVVVLSIAIAAVMVMRRYWAELTLTVLTFASLLSSTYYLSVSRSTLTVFPLIIVAASVIAPWRRWAGAVAIVVSGAWMTWIMGAFPLQYWAG